VSKTFGLKVTPTSSGYHVAAAQELIPPPSSQSAAASLPVPAPEPGTWLVFIVILGAAGLRLRAVTNDRYASSGSNMP
jgi:hypothetical protein